MELLTALKIADTMGIPTVKEAIHTIERQKMSLFPFGKMESEICELLIDYENNKKKHGIKDNDYVWKIIPLLKED